MFETRLKNLKQLLKKESLDGVFISSVSNITYLSGFSNFSKDEREAYLLIGQNFEYIITDGRYTEAVKKEVPHLELFERGYKNKTEKLFKKLKSKIKNLAIEENNLTVAERNLLLKHFKKIKHLDISSHRNIKSEEEIKKIEKACKLGDKTFEYIIKKIEPGISEKDLALEIEFFIKKNGVDLSFPPIVAFGKNSSVPHHHTGGTKLGPESSSGREGLIILLDFGVKLENYCSDMTRTIFFGNPANNQMKIYQTVLEAQQKAIDVINSSVKAGKSIKAAGVDKVAREYIISQGYPSIPHSLGHGVGLEVHEGPRLSPKSKDILKTGMVFSIEPGIYLENFGGVRIEDLFVLEKNNLRQLTTSQKSLIRI